MSRESQEQAMLSLTKPRTKPRDVAGPANILDEDACWDAMCRRDPTADGTFFYSVRTTGVYCRPSCAARPRRENVAFHATAADAERAGFRPCKRCRPNGAMKTGTSGIDARVAAIDWAEASAQLDVHGCATVGPVLTEKECSALVALYDADAQFRSRIVMARHGFGRGEYKYFAYPLPDMVAALRTALYPPLADIANRWNAAMGIAVRYPDDHAAFLKRCHAAGQGKPTPLLLRYGAGDYNCLHQDLYGEHVFPLQVAFLLSRPAADFEGGEFVLTEQRPRMQSRAEVVPLVQGQGVMFPVHHRPVQGTRGIYRVNMRHGVSRLRAGTRHTLGVIFHDAR
jgi:uncharacterized protein